MFNKYWVVLFLMKIIGWVEDWGFNHALIKCDMAAKEVYIFLGHIGNNNKLNCPNHMKYYSFVLCSSDPVWIILFDLGCHNLWGILAKLDWLRVWKSSYTRTGKCQKCLA